MERALSPKRVLIVEDEADLRSTLAYNFARSGFHAMEAQNAAEGLRLALGSRPPDLVLLDLLLPDRPGTEVCRIIRQNSQTAILPIIMLTACDAEIDRIKGFEVGADDYVAKPFSTRELLLRARALLRRTNNSFDATQILSAGSIRLDLGSHRAWAGQREVTLCALEFRLLSTLIQRRDRVQERGVLLSDVWGISQDVKTRTVDVHIKRLRSKLGELGKAIETVHGVGYRLSNAAACTPAAP